MRQFGMRVVLILILLSLIAGTLCAGEETPDSRLIETVSLFDHNDIHFSPDSASAYATEAVLSDKDGREIYTRRTLPSFDADVRITAHLAIHPVPKDDRAVCDKWDRAGNIRLVKDGMADIELVKFITSFGGETAYDVDISQLAPLLTGDCEFRGFIDTWVSPAWQVDFSLTYETIADSSEDGLYIDFVYNPDWGRGIMFEPSYTAEKYADSGLTVTVDVPEGTKRILLNYLVSGHCTDGNGADEFVPKDNVILIDDQVVYRYQPWRDDCRQFRSVNPYTGRWSDGYWSSDFSRTGWCPGDKVLPLQIDVSDFLTPGKHTITFRVEGVRPKNDKGDYGYWRLSSYLVGWNKLVNVVKW